MRVGIDLRGAHSSELVALAKEADDLGLWAVLTGGPSGSEATIAAELAVETEHIHLAMWFDGDSAHPHTIAEEIAIVDHLSRRRALAVINGANATHVRDLLAGMIVDGAALAPPPAQTAVPVWESAQVMVVELSGELARDQTTIDGLRDGGETHVFVSSPGPLPVLARHLATRAATASFPQIVADQADMIAPLEGV